VCVISGVEVGEGLNSVGVASGRPVEAGGTGTEVSVGGGGVGDGKRVLAGDGTVNSGVITCAVSVGITDGAVGVAADVA